MINCDEDDFDREYLYRIMLECADCGHIFRKEHEYVCPVCSSRNVQKPSKEAIEQYCK